MPVGDLNSQLRAVAEAERNRTSQTEVLGLNGFEDRAAHQDGYASLRPRWGLTCALTLPGECP